MANRSRDLLIHGGYQKTNKFILPLVSQLHPSTTVLTPTVKNAFQKVSLMDPVLGYLVPTSSVIVAYKKLPNLQLLLCKNDQNSLVSRPHLPQITGYTNTSCKCLLCKASLFGRYATSPAMPGFRINLPSNTSCRSGPGVVYHAICKSGKPHCKLAHYVGRAFSSDPAKPPMPGRWSCHKSQHKKNYNRCKLVDHLIKFHQGENPQDFVKVMILEQTATFEETVNCEIKWTRKLFAYYPTGLNTREEESISYEEN